MPYDKPPVKKFAVTEMRGEGDRVGVMEITMFHRPDGTFQAVMMLWNGNLITGQKKTTANAAMRDLMEVVIYNPIFDGQL